MEVRRNIKTRLPDHHDGSGDAALHFPAIAGESVIDFAEIFKKTPYAAGLKPHRRDAAKDMLEIAAIPLRMKALRGDREIGAAVGLLNVKLTGAEPAEHETKWKLRKTNPRSGASREWDRQIGPGAHESQCYADS